MLWKVEYYHEGSSDDYVFDTIVVRGETLLDAYLAALVELGTDYLPSSGKYGISFISLIEN